MGLKPTPWSRKATGDHKFLANLVAGRISLTLLERAERFMIETPVEGFSLAGTPFEAAQGVGAPGGVAPSDPAAPGSATADGYDTGAPETAAGAGEAGKVSSSSCADDAPAPGAIPCR